MHQTTACHSKVCGNRMTYPEPTKSARAAVTKQHNTPTPHHQHTSMITWSYPCLIGDYHSHSASSINQSRPNHVSSQGSWLCCSHARAARAPVFRLQLFVGSRHHSPTTMTPRCTEKWPTAAYQVRACPANVRAPARRHPT